MRKPGRLLAMWTVLVVAASPLVAETEFGAREGGIRGGPPPETRDLWGLLVEDFADVGTLPDDGWVMINHSEPIGTTSWFQGWSQQFPAQEGYPWEYIAANYNNCGVGDPGIISTWLISPEFEFHRAAGVNFWTRTVFDSAWPDRLQVRLSTSGDSTDVGTTAMDVGDFGLVLFDINGNYNEGGYPEDWRHYYSDDLPSTGSGRVAFRYFVENAGPAGVNSNYIGIDSFVVDEVFVDGGTPEVPATGASGAILLFALFLTVSSFFFLRRRGHDT